MFKKTPVPHNCIVVMIAITVFAGSGQAQTVAATRCSTGVHEAEAMGRVFFPQDHIFCPLLADPKEPRYLLELSAWKVRQIGRPIG
jgi:hypothetical protein